jgi:muconolactone delta-isomerase
VTTASRTGICLWREGIYSKKLEVVPSSLASLRAEIGGIREVWRGLQRRGEVRRVWRGVGSTHTLAQGYQAADDVKDV